MGDLRRTATGAVVMALIGIALATGAAQAAKFKVLQSFAPKLGENPMGPVLIDQAGNIFGTASQAGPRGGGTVYELKPKGGGYKATSIFRFCLSCGTGQAPNGPLIIDTQGNLYGTADNVVFELSPIAGQKHWSEKILYQFCLQQNCIDGSNPIGGLTYVGAATGAAYDGTSPLYGTTGNGGAKGGGTVFQLSNGQGKWTESVIYSFCSEGGNSCTDGKLPLGRPFADGAGNLFGATFEGGNAFQGVGAGIIYELSPAGKSWTETTLYRFCALAECSDGALPTGDLAMDATGALYGTTGVGGMKCEPGAWGCGVLYRLIPNGAQSQEAVLYAFCKERDCRDGSAPQAGLLINSDGSLIGTTYFGGGNDIDVEALGGGVVFELTGTAYKVLHRFCSLDQCADGEYPTAQLVMDKDSRFLGSASMGGAFGDSSLGGTVFELRR